jgi:MoaA/NifB/PqqE/SkfB family radical SAM enzyme
MVIVISLEPVNCTLHGKRNCRYDEIKDFNMGRLSWIIKVRSKCNYKCPYNSKIDRLDYRRKVNLIQAEKDFKMLYN